jgi:hypothetical protein
VTLFFRPSVPLFYEFAQGRTEPYPTYLLCGPEPMGQCVGIHYVIVNPTTKEIVFNSPLSGELYRASHEFDCLSLYSMNNPSIQVGLADTRLVQRGEWFQLDLLQVDVECPYEEDLQRVISALS